MAYSHQGWNEECWKPLLLSTSLGQENSRYFLELGAIRKLGAIRMSWLGTEQTVLKSSVNMILYIYI
jgi:hypothetical protein